MRVDETELQITLNGPRLLDRIEALATIGAVSGGGVSRVAFTEDDRAAREQVNTWMTAAGMATRIDAAGNLIGRYDGLNPNLPALATGSHIDTVTRGGKYDGCLGVLAGIELVETLSDRQHRLQHPIEVIVFTDEESTVIGSKAMAGQIPPGAANVTLKNNRRLSECLQSIGGDWDRIQTATRTATDIAAFIELHVEQGGELERHDCAIGIVTGIVGQYRYRLTIDGQANHAGTTPMNDRQDALVAAAQVILAVQATVQATVQAMSSDAVGTVGYLSNYPNVTNTISGRVELSLDLRDLDADRLSQVIESLQMQFDRIAQTTRTTFTLEETLHIAPTIAADPIIQSLEQICDRRNLSHRRLPSRAGHDAQEIGRITNMGMIFVPSRGGISHDHTEYTAPEACIQGAIVLLDLFRAIDEDFGRERSM